MWVHKKNCSKNLFVDIFGQLWQTLFLVIVKTSILNVPKKRTGPFTDKPSNRTPPRSQGQRHRAGGAGDRQNHGPCEVRDRKFGDDQSGRPGRNDAGTWTEFWQIGANTWLFRVKYMLNIEDEYTMI